MLSTVRELRLELLACHSNTGRLLAQTHHAVLLVQRGDINVDHAAMCIELFVSWELYLQAEQWAVDHQTVTPASLPEALMLLRQWRRHYVH